MKIKSQILAGYVVIAAIFTVMNCVDLLLIRNVRHDLARLVHETIPAHSAVQGVRWAGYMMLSRIQEFLFLVEEGKHTGNKEGLSEHIAMDINEFKQARASAYQELGQYAELVVRAFPNEKRNLDILQARVDRMSALGDEFIQWYSVSGDFGDAVSQKAQFEEVEEHFTEIIDRIIFLEKLEVGSQTDTAKQSVEDVSRLVYGSFILILAFAIGIGLIVSRTIATPIRRLEQASRKIAQGEAVARVDIASKNELGQLAAAFNIMIGHTRQTREDLEKTVQERTVRLEESNAALRQEIKRHEALSRENRMLEERLLQNQKMEAIGTLAGGIAHDFNNLLGAIFGYTELSIGCAAPGTAMERNLKGVKSAVDRAAQLTRQILAFSRRVKRELSPVKVTTVLQEVIAMLRASIPATIDIRPEIDESSASVMIMADLGQLHQILMNLCVNAYHAMREQGKGVLTVAAGKTMISADDEVARECRMPAGAYLRLKVSDTGCGIDAQILPKIFDPYFTTKEQGEGTGLGLAVVHGIVQTLSGYIRVKSEAGRGTTFQVFFPAIDETGRAETVEQEAIHPGSERILFVDDEEFITQSYTLSLQGLGYTVTAVTSSVDALRLFREDPEKFDLVITDMTMPEMTGEELVRKIFAVRPGFPVILCTGFSESMNEDTARELGVRVFIMKPMLLSQITAAIREICDGPGVPPA